jgi:hypothetical protein
MPVRTNADQQGRIPATDGPQPLPGLWNREHDTMLGKFPLRLIACVSKTSDEFQPVLIEAAVLQ